VVVEKCALSLAEDTHVYRSTSVNPHTLQGFGMRDGRDYQHPSILEADKTSVEQVID
jgi:hypothetical protein